MRWSMLFVIGLFFSGCHTSKIPQAPDSGLDAITFGHGGGFTGAVHAFLLQEDGHLFSGDGELTHYKHIGKLDSNKAKQYLSIIRRLFDQHTPINRPGNTYQYLGLSHGGKVQKFTWQNEEDVPKEAGILYQILKRALPEMKE